MEYPRRPSAEYLRLNGPVLGKLRAEAKRLIPLKEVARRAAELAEQGYWVFPCKITKDPCTKHGKDNATDHPKKAYEMFMSHHNATSIGVKCGVDSMIVVIDVDPKGREWLEANFNRLGETRLHMTMRGGIHIIYKMPGPPHPIITARQRVNGEPLLSRGVDIQGEGRYVIWAGSPGYHVVHDVPPADMPPWMRRRLLRKEQPRTAPNGSVYSERPSVRALEGALARVEKSIVGERNNIIYWAACRAGELVKEGLLGRQKAIDLVITSAMKIPPGSGKDVLTKDEIVNTVLSGVRTTS